MCTNFTSVHVTFYKCTFLFQVATLGISQVLMRDAQAVPLTRSLPPHHQRAARSTGRVAPPPPSTWDACLEPPLAQVFLHNRWSDCTVNWTLCAS